MTHQSKEMAAQPVKLMNRNFFLLWQGQFVSTWGSQAFAVAMIFWIKHVTGSAALMGLLQMLAGLPAVVLGPIGGAFADRYSRRQIIILSDLVRGVVVLALAGLVFLLPEATQLTLVALFVVAVLISSISAFFGPAISAAIPDLVPRSKVASANSLGQMALQLSLFIGQGLGGTFYRLLGASVLFLIDGSSYLFAAASETFVDIPQTMPRQDGGWRKQLGQFRQDIAEGLRYIWGQKGLRELVFVSAFLVFFTAPVIVLLPFFVEDTLQVAIDWYGFLLAAYGLGTLMGYLFAGALQFSAQTRKRLMILFIVLESAGYGLLGLIEVPEMALVLALLGGFTGGFVTVNITTILQVATPGEIRGRVFGLLATISGSLTPVAMGLAGVVADLLDQNIPLIYATCGVIMLLLTLWVSASREFRSLLAQPLEARLSEPLDYQSVLLD
ncbi:MAG: MFS transporter [Chloroflexota bacterium]